MSLVLAKRTSLWKQISTNAMQSPLSSLILFQSHSGSTAGTALITAHHTPRCLSPSPRFLTNACIYLSHLPQFIIPARARSPGQRPSLTRGSSALLLAPPDATATISSCQGEGDPSQTRFQLSAVLRNTLTSTRTCLKGHCRCTFTVLSLCSSSFYSS